MEIQQADYLGSFPSYQVCPGDGVPEFAFIGRSNVGKSSLINMLCRRSALAHTSKKPGKTQTINLFLIDGLWRLVDLPGYGYAAVSKSQRRNWEKMIQDYLALRSELVCAFVLLDANIPPQKLDIEFINRLGALAVPFALIYTKADRSKPAELEENIRQIQSALLEYWHELPRQFVSAAQTGLGREEILEYIGSLRSEFLP
jgi:GTP-binding protein